MITNRRRSVSQVILNLLVIAGIIFSGWLPAPQAADGRPENQVPPGIGLANDPPPRTLASLPKGKLERAASSSFWADVDGDQDVDEDDLGLVAEIWNCTSGEACYDATYDGDGDGDIDALDLAAVGNEFDVSPPELVVEVPANNSVTGGANLLVSGTVGDSHSVSSVMVNGLAATVDGGGFEALVPLEAGNQTILVQAADEIGQESTVTRLVFADQEGPFITVNGPADRGSVYTLRPSVAVSYTDFYTGVNPATLAVSLSPAGGGAVDITSDLVIDPSGASGSISFDLSENTVYTLSATLEDALGNLGAVTSVFYVPSGAESITPPAVPENAGWISGVIYDSSTCDLYLIDCQGILGVHVTLSEIVSETLGAARQQRAADLAEFGPSAMPGTGPLSASAASTVTSPVSGTIVTGPDGFFAFPVDATGRYALRADKEGHTYGQRVAEIVRGHSAPVNEIYLTPLDPAVTLCGNAGCNHTSADGQVQVIIPPGAITGGEQIEVTATEFDRVYFLPSGELPPGTGETYAFNLGGDSDYQFQQPVTVTIKNSRGFAPGEIIPLGFWNAELLQWEHAGVATVAAGGEWLTMQVTHFSNYDPNTAQPAGAQLALTDQTRSGEGAADPCGSCITMRAGYLRQEVTLPEVQVLGEPVAPVLNYASDRAAPSSVIEAQLTIDPSAGITNVTYVQAELFIEGQKTDNFSFAVGDVDESGEIGHFRYFWDGRDAQGRRLPPGVYPYAIHVRMPYEAQYYRTLGNIFGFTIDYGQPMGVYSSVTEDTWLFGSVLLAGNSNDPFGAGWNLADMQRLYEDESGRILIDDGQYNPSEYYFPAQNQVPNGESVVPAAGAGLEGLFGSPDRIEEPAGPAPYPAGALVETPWPLSSSGPTETAAEEFSGREQAGSNANAVGGFGAQALVTTTVSGPIVTDTVWTTAGSPYVLTADVTVNPGVTLTVEPGVVVKGQLNAELQVGGHLEAIGAPAQPITFTSDTDSGPGEWQGLLFLGGTGHLNYATVRYGGYGSGSFYYANVAVLNTPAGGEVRVENSVILGAVGSGPGTPDSGLYASNSTVVVSNTLFSGNGDAGNDTALHIIGAGSRLTLTGSDFQDNTGRPVRLPPETLHLLGDDNSFEGNEINRIFLASGSLTADAALPLQAGLEAYQLEGDLIVSDGHTMVIEPGVVVEGQLNAELRVEGHLEAVGTPAQPIIFTSAANSGPGEWQGLLFLGGTGHLNYATVRYGGYGSGSFYYANVAAVNTPAGGEVRVENSQILYALGSAPATTDFGIYASNSTVVVSNTLIFGNGNDDNDYGFYSTGASTVITAVNNIFQANTGQPLRAPLASLPNIDGNSFYDNFSTLIRVYGAATLNESLTLEKQLGITGYILEAALTVAPSATLKIEPGLDTYWNQDLTVNGRLEAIGNPAAPILFTSLADFAPGDWNGILIAPGGDVELEWATIRHAVTGLALNNGSGRVKNAAIYDNSAYGINVYGSTADFAITLSEIRDNGQLGVRNITGVVVDALFNWWGHPFGPYHPTLNPGGLGNEVDDDVLFDPWLETPVTDLDITNLTPTDYSLLLYDGGTGTYSRHYPDGTVVAFNADGTHDYTLGPEGTKVAYTYDSAGRVATMAITLAGESEPDWVWTFDYQPAAGLRLNALLGDTGSVAITDPAGRVTTLTLDGNGHLVAIQQPGLSAPMEFAYTPEGRMTHKTDERGFMTTYTYDSRGRIARAELPPRPVFDPASGLFTVEPQVRNYAPVDTGYQLANDLAPGTPVSPTDSLVQSEELLSTQQVGDVAYSGQTSVFGSPLTATDSLSRTARYERDDRDRLIRAIRPDGSCTVYTYDDRGNILTEIAMGPADCALGADQEPQGLVQELSFTYEPRFNQISAATDALGRVTRYTYDYEVGQGERGLLVEIGYPSVPDEQGVVVSPTETFTYTVHGLLARETDKRGVATCYLYTQGTAEEASGGANPLFASGVTPVPGHLTQVKEDCDGPQEAITIYKDFDAIGNAQTIVLPATSAGQRHFTLAYDDRGRLISEIDPLGTLTTYTYDNAGNIIEATEDAGGISRVYRFTYDAANQLLEESISGGSQTSSARYGYNLNGSRTLVQNSAGHMTRYFYDAANQLVSMEDALGQATTFTYSPIGLLESTTDPRGATSQSTYDWLGRETQFVYDSGGLNLTYSETNDAENRLVHLTDARGVETCYTYDGLDRLLSQIEDCGGLNATMSYTYDLNGNKVSMTDPEGRVTQYGYDNLNRLTQVTDPLGYTTVYTLDVVGNRLAMEDRLGRITTYTYDLLDREITSTDPLGGVITYGYDALDQLVSVTDKLGRASTYAYDILGRRTQITDPAGNLTTFEYDGNGNQVATTDPLGRRIRTFYDALDRPTAYVETDGTLTTHQYDPVGNLTAITDPLNRTTSYTYDNLNRQTAIVDALDQTTTYTYDGANNLTAITDPLGQVQYRAYDGLNRTIIITDASGAETNYVYDLVGNQTSLTDPVGNTTTFAYDDLDRLITETNTLDDSRAFEYDPADNIIAYTDRNGRERTLTYDALDRVVAETWIGDGRIISYTYDAMSQGTAVQDPDSAYSMTYDSLGRNTAVSNSGTPGAPDVTINYTYDAFSNVTAVNEIIDGQSGAATIYSYDVRNRMARVTQSGGGAAPKRTDFTYNAVNFISTMQRYGDLAGSQPVAESVMGYDDTNRLTSLSHQPATGASRDFTWVFDDASRPTGVTLPGGATTFGYDARHQLLSADHTHQNDESYTYDPAGNRSGGGYVVGPANRLSTDGVYNYTYDDEGNRVQRVDIATGAVTEYEWDYRNRLTRVVFKDPDLNVTKAISHTYDVYDRRIATTVDPDGDGSETGTTERFVYDGMHIALVFDGAGEVTHRYLYGPRVDFVLAGERVGDQTTWLLGDRLGSIVDTVDSSGALQKERTYDAYGNITGDSDPGEEGRFAFTGREWDEASGLYYYRGRYYDPRVGQFIGEDPIGFLGGDTNLYRYVLNFPTGLTDPSGTSSLGFWRSFDRALARADQFVAGFADSVSNGLTTKIRGATYGHTATKNHQGAVFTAGQVTGTATSVAIGVGGPMQAAKGAQLAKSGKGLVEVGKNAMKQAARYQNKARMAGKMGLPRRTLQLLQKSISRRANGTEMLVDGWMKLNRAERLLNSARAANMYNYAQFIWGGTDLVMRWYNADPCDPLSWWDLLYLIPVAKVLWNRIRPLARLPKPPPQRALTKGDKWAQAMGFEDLEAYRAYSRKRIVEYADARLRTRDVKTLEKWEETIKHARKGGVEEFNQRIRLTEEGANEMMRKVREVMEESPGLLTLDASVNDGMRKLITGTAEEILEGSNRFGSITKIPIVPRTPGPLPLPGPAPGTGGTGVDTSDLETIFFSVR